MNREEYLNQLKKHLKKLPKSDYENAMEYFTEYFEEVGEQQAMEELGTPEEAAADIVNNLLSQNPKNGHKGGKQGKIKILFGICLLLFGVAAIVLLASMGNRKENGDIKVDTGDIKVGNIQKNDTDGIQEDTNGIKTWQSDDIRLDSVSSITADLNYIDLDIAVSDDDDFHMSYELHCMNRKNPLSYHLENGLLKLAEKDFKAPSLRSWIWNTDSMTNKYYSYITLYVPSNTVLKSCNLNMADGDLTINGLHCNLMEIKAVDGDMNIKDGSCQKAVLKAEDGDIILSNSIISEDLQFNTADGDISVSDLNIKGTAGFDTADGDISASGLSVDGTVQIDTADGDISCAGFKASEGMKIKVEDGDIRISGLASAGAVEILSGDGDIAISDFKESKGLFLQTECGDISGSSISITGKMQINTADGDVALSNLGAFGKIDIASESGDISLQIQKKSLSGLKMTVDTEDGELLVARSLGGKKRSGHYERDGSASKYLNVDMEEGDISIQ